MADERRADDAAGFAPDTGHGICRVCGRDYALRPDGRLVSHPRQKGEFGSGICQGAGCVPADARPEDAGTPNTNIKVETEAVGAQDQKPIQDKRPPLTVPYETRTYFSTAHGTVYGLFPIDGVTPPRFQGESVAKAKPAGPLPGVELTFRFDIVGATTPAEAFEQYDAACQNHAPAAKQAAAKEWYKRYGNPAATSGMQRAGILDATGAPVQKRVQKIIGG